MGIFSRRRQPVAEPPAWRPMNGLILTAPADAMEGECAAGQAYGTRFTNGDAVMTIWAFAGDCGPTEPACWFVAFRVDHAVLGGQWSANLYYGDLAWAEWYPSLDKADGKARDAITGLIAGYPDESAQHIKPSVIAGWLDWDGAPW